MQHAGVSGEMLASCVACMHNYFNGSAAPWEHKGSVLPNRMCFFNHADMSCVAHALILAHVPPCKAAHGAEQGNLGTCVADQTPQAALARHIPELDHAVRAPRCLSACMHACSWS